MADDKMGGMFSKVRQFVKKAAEEEFKHSFAGMIREKLLDLRRAFLRTVAGVIFLAFGISLVFIGLAQYLAYIFPVLSEGIGIILFGLILIIISLLIWNRK